MALEISGDESTLRIGNAEAELMVEVVTMVENHC